MSGHVQAGSPQIMNDRTEVEAKPASLVMEIVPMNSGNREHDRDFSEPGGTSEEAAVFFAPPISQLRPAVVGVIERNGAALAKVPGVCGVSESRTPTGEPVVRIDVEDEMVRARLPEQIEGYQVEVVVVPGGFGIQPIR